MAAGVKKTFKGEIIGEDYTRWPGNLDFSTELSKVRAAKPDAVWVFYPGQAGAQFFQQYSQAGLKDQIPLYRCVLGRCADLAVHQRTSHWVT